MEITVKMPSEAWEKRLHAVSERMGCPGDYEEVLGRSLSLAAVITSHLEEDNATVQLCSPRSGSSLCEPGPLYGHGPGLTEDDMGGFVG
jgi:hypothetical protein